MAEAPPVVRTLPRPSDDLLAKLQRRREVTIRDMQVKAEFEDWHGVMDCAADLREVDTALGVLRDLTPS